MSYPVYHITGCGDVAFFFIHEPYEGMLLDPSVVVYPDGSSPPIDDETKALCGSCGQDLEVSDLTARGPLTSRDWSVPRMPPLVSSPSSMGLTRP